VKSNPGGSFLFTARVALVLAVLLPLLWIRLAVVRDERRAFELVQRCARRVLRLAGCRMTVLRLDRMPADGQAMLVSNHASLADAAVLLAALPFQFRFVANHVFAGYPILGAAIRAASAHVVDRASWRSRAECGQTMVDALQDGHSLLVFPEGTTNTGDLLPFRRGAFRAAAQSGRPIVPIALRGTREMFPPDTFRLTNVPITIELLQPIVAADQGRNAIAALRDRAADAIRIRLAGDEAG
jgi:1-acyl-sn-glycerol-3-phosphate acyltransferase